MRWPVETDVAVIVAAVEDRADVARCLHGFLREVAGRGRVVLVDGTTDRSASAQARIFAEVEIVPAVAGSLAPELWRDGIEATSESLIALSTTQMIPADGWLDGMLDLYGAAAVGGPIEPGKRLSGLDRAVYLLRYFNYMKPLRHDSKLEPPGDNALYRRDVLFTALENGPLISSRSGSRLWVPLVVLDQCLPPGARSQRTGRGRPVAPRICESQREMNLNPLSARIETRGLLQDRVSSHGPATVSMPNGFWETQIHRSLREQGETLTFSDKAAVTFQGGNRLVPILGQRFLHARHYGFERASRLGRRQALARIVASPLIPGLMLGRIVAALVRRRTRVAPWLAALPWLVPLLMAWTLGETVGLWSGTRRRES